MCKLARSKKATDQLVAMARLHLYNKGLPCGAAAVQRYLRDSGDMQPLPSIWRINRILACYGLSYARTGWYEGDVLDWLPASAQVPQAERKSI